MTGRELIAALNRLAEGLGDEVLDLKVDYASPDNDAYGPVRHVQIGEYLGPASKSIELTD